MEFYDNPMSAKCRVLALLAFFLCFAIPLQAKQTFVVDPASGAETREIHTNGVIFSLTQLLPDQVRAFYVNRGFTLPQTEAYATACVFMTVLRNEKAVDAIHFILQDWSIVTKGHSKPPMKVEDWVDVLAKEGVKKPALIAFRWAQFPPEQSYEPGGDWNQGMLSTGLPAGSSFDIIARWDMAGEIYEGVLHDVHCAR